jgi:hypothetical protein
LLKGNYQTKFKRVSVGYWKIEKKRERKNKE